MFEGYLKEPSRSGETAYWEALWAMVADRARRPREAHDHLKAAGYRLTGAAFFLDEKETPARFVARVVLAASPAAAELALAAKRREAFDVEGALAAYRSALTRDPAPRTAAALAAPIAALELERLLARGQWVPFLPSSPDLAGWSSELGAWRLSPDGSLEGASGARGLLLVSEARVGDDFEVRGRMDLVSSTNGFFQGGVVFGHPSWDGQDWMSFRIKRNGKAGEGRLFLPALLLAGPDARRRGRDAPDVNTFLVRVQAGELTATVNGVAVAEGLTPKKGLVMSPDLRLGFGGYVDENVVSLRFRDVQLRRLPSP